MKWRFGIEPDLNHYTCIVDLLGRFGKLKEALAIILKVVAFPDSRIWAHSLQPLVSMGTKKLRNLQRKGCWSWNLIMPVIILCLAMFKRLLNGGWC